MAAEQVAITHDTGAAVPAAPPYPAPAVGWLAVVVLSVLYILSMLDRNIITLLAESIRSDLQISDFQLSLLYGIAFALFYCTAALPLGWAIDRFRRRKVIYWCVTFWSASTVFCGFASSFPALFAARAGVGAGEAALVPGSNSILSDLFAPNRLALPLSVYAVGAKVGQSLSLLIGGALTTIVVPTSVYALPVLGAMKGWQLVFIIIGLPGLLLALLIFAFPEPARRFQPASGAPSRGYDYYLRFMAQRKRLFVAHHLGYLLFLAVSVALTSWSPAFLQRVHGLSTAQVGAQLGAALLIGSLIGMPLHGMIVDRRYGSGVVDAHLRHLIAMAMLGTPIGIAAYLVPDPMLSIVLIGLFMCVISAYSSVPMVVLQLFVPGDLRGKAAATLLLINGTAGISLGPMTVAALTDFVFHDPAKVGWGIAICAALFLPVAAIAFAIALRPLRRALNEAATGIA